MRRRTSNRRFRGTLAAALVIGAAAVVSCARESGDASSAEAVAGVDIRQQLPTADVEALLQPGDLVFRRGNGRWSGYFAVASGGDGYFSHVGLAQRTPDGWRVLHSEADEGTGIDGVRADPVDLFLTGARGVAIARPVLDDAQRQALVDLADSPRWRAIPFDRAFVLDDGGSAMYCTEWVQAVALAATGVDIARPRTVVGGREVISIDDLLRSPRVAVVAERRMDEAAAPE